MNVKDDSLSRKLYAQDASMYQQLPTGVAFPKTTDDIVQLVRQANLDGFSITARSAGTSLAGQTTGGGVIMDVSRFMTELIEINEDEHWADVEPGVIRDTLNNEAAQYDLLFGPDTTTSNRCMIGGMIGNNSSGIYSIKYKTTREHILEMDVVLSDGSTATFKPLTEDELEEKLQHETLEGDIYRGMLKLLKEYKDLIQENYPHPEIIRKNTGYALDKLCEMAPIEPEGRPFNLCELLCGSEGTLALTTNARLNLEPIPSEKIVLIPHFNSLNDAMLATMAAVRMKPTAVELVDKAILDATKGNQMYHPHRFFISGEPKYVLIIQFDGDNAAILQKKTERLKDRLREKKLCYSYPIIKTKEDIEKVWELRHAGIIHLNRKGSVYSPIFCEDTAVRVNDLPSYTKEVKEIFANYKLESIIYGNASVGTLHFRPVIDTTNDEGLEILKKTAAEMADLVGTYKGSLTGAHGDGRVRSPFIKQAMGEELVEVLKEVKYLWDKFGVFNPGKIVDPEPMEKDLRFSANYEPYDFKTEFAWRDEGGIHGMIESCNGVGVCRKLAQSGGTMCPSYMATKDEKDSPRGRANIFRQVFEGENPEAFNSSDLKEALEFCLSCKACKSECPSNVDMAKLKAEFEYGWQQKNRLSDEHVYFSRAYKAYKYAIKYPRVSNYIISKEFGKHMLNVFFGISKARTLPALSLNPFNVKEYEFPKTAQKKVALIVDMFTQYYHPQIADAAVKVFNFLGYEVIIPHLFDTGRIAISKGRLDIAKENAQHMLITLKPLVDQKIPIVGLEPSELLTLRDEFLDLVDEEALEKATDISKYSFLFEEFLIRHPVPTQIRNGGKVLVHQHCHSKVLSPKNTLQHMLERWGFDVVMLDAGCCGMAGTFGYEHDTYELSMKIGEERLFPSVKLNLKNNICAPGFSCRHQIFDGTKKHALHPAELIAQQVINM
jgi:FAD/FMN-containing dehydrogenase/Fe-S oxidoreductase